MQVLDDVYHASYQNDSVEPRIVEAFDVIAREIKRMFGTPLSAMDVGCGGGALIRGLLAYEIDAYGLEGSSHGVKLMPDRIKQHDLRDAYKCKWADRYDLVTCSDVAEHVEPDYANTLCDTLSELTKPGGWLLFGAAGEGQDGLGHVNCQHPCYWIGKLEARGFKLFPNVSEELRTKIKANEGHSTVWWYAKNVMVFKKGVKAWQSG